MAVKVIKEGIDVGTKQDIDSQVRETVEATLKHIEAEGDAAVRELVPEVSTATPPNVFGCRSPR